MKNVARLVRIQFWSVLSDVLSFSKNKKKPKLVSLGILAFSLGMAVLSFVYNIAIGQSLVMFGSVDLLPPLMMAITSVIVLFTTIYKIKGTIFGFRDYDMIMSLPISTSKIVASRVVLLYSINMFFVLIVMVPMMIAYGILARPGIMFYIMGLLTLVVLPLLPIVIASVIGTGIAMVASKFRHHNFANIILTLILLIGIMGLSFTMDQGTPEDLARMNEMLMDRVNQIYPLTAFYVKAVIEYDIVALLIFLGLSIAAFYVFSFLVGRLFIKLNTSMMSSSARGNYQAKEMRQMSVLKALFVKELRRYFSSSIYVLNTIFGVVMLTVGTIALFFVDLEQVLGEPAAIDMIKQTAPIILSFFVVIGCTTTSSISLEGRNLWIMKSLPLESKHIFLSKIGVNMFINLPVFVDILLLAWILQMNFMQSVYMLLLPAVNLVFAAILGLLINLQLPNFTWTSETAVVKQSAASFISVLSSMLIIGIQMVIASIVVSPYTFAVLVLGMAIVAWLLYQLLMTWGARRFRSF